MAKTLTPRDLGKLSYLSAQPVWHWPATLTRPLTTGACVDVTALTILLFFNVWQFKERTAGQSRAPTTQCCWITCSLPGQRGQVTMMMLDAWGDVQVFSSFGALSPSLQQEEQYLSTRQEYDALHTLPVAAQGRVGLLSHPLLYHPHVVWLPGLQQPPELATSIQVKFQLWLKDFLGQMEAESIPWKKKI